MKYLELIFVYLLGAVGYGGIEMLWRGHTHWSMLVLGGLCFLCIYFFVTRVRLPLWKRWLLCTVAVTLLEFLCGCLVNRFLGWNVWDYSDQPGNILGQICPIFMLLWYLLSIPCSMLALAVHRFIFSAHRQ